MNLHALDVVHVLVSKEFKVRYRGTVLGYVWSLLNPLAFAAVFYFLFQIIHRMETEQPYALVLITALFPWQWLANSVGESSLLFVGQASLIKKVRFERSLLVLAAVLYDMLHFAVAIPVVAIFMLIFGLIPSAHWLWQIPVLIVIQACLVFGLSLIVATLNLLFRDLERLVGIGLLIGMYLTPVLYPASKLEDKGYEWALYVNPMASLIHCWRSVFLDGHLPGLPLAIAAFAAMAILWVGLKTYRTHEGRFAELV